MKRRLSLPRHRVRITAWLGLTLVSIQMLAGGVSAWHTLQRLHLPVGWTVVCSAQGIRAIPPSGDSREAPATTAAHCPYCLSALHIPLLPVQMAAPLRGAPIQVSAHADTTAPLFSVPRWLHAPSRAPPALG